MIYLFTGLPGSSKTLNVLKFVCEDPAFKGREVYYHRIKELKLPWTELDQDGVRAWDTLPDGSVLVVDEAQYLLPTRDSRTPMPDWILGMSEHRHKGYDLIFISQSPMILDAGFRRFVNRHTHLERVFGMESSKWLTWEKCVSDVEDFFSRKAAVVNRVAFDKKYYGLYKSAEVHTHKRKIPMKVFIPFFALFVMGILVYLFLDRMQDRGLDDLPIPVVSSVSSLSGLQTVSGSSSEKGNDSVEGYVAALSPRLPDVPWSAPVYDDLTTPKSFPRPQCIRFNLSGVCKCFTQQATPLNISTTACYNYVENGYFDHTKVDDYGSPSASAGAQAGGRDRSRVDLTSL